METTKTVEGTFGPRQVTRDEFVNRWAGHCDQMFHLAHTTAQYHELQHAAARQGTVWTSVGQNPRKGPAWPRLNPG